MLKMVKWLVLIGGILATTTPARADFAPTDLAWNDSTRQALAQCFVGESGFRTRTEHAAIGYVLLRNWQLYLRTHPGASFENRIRDYCAVHRVVDPSPRQRWVRRLPWGTLEDDPGMSEHTEWRHWIDDWDYTMETVRLFEAGELTDPLPEAEHWGSGTDGTPLGGHRLPVQVARATGEEAGEPAVVMMHNYFYAVDHAEARRMRRMICDEAEATGHRRPRLCGHR